MRYFSIRWRLVLSYVLLTVLAVAAVSTLALALIQSNLAQREAELLRVNADAVARQAGPLFVPRADRYNLQQLADTAAFLGNAQVRILDRGGNPIVDSGPRRAADRLMLISPQRGQTNSPSSPSVLMMGMMSDDGRGIPPEAILESAPWLQEMMPNARIVVIERVPSAYGSRFRFTEVQAVPAQAAQPAQVADERPSASAARVNVPISMNGTAVGSVEMSGMTSVGAQTLADAQRALLLAGAGAAALAMLMGLLVSRGLTAPLRSLAVVAGRMAQGNLTVRAPGLRKPLRDETDQLAAQFNDMAAKLEASFNALAAERDALRRFIADASHELRTPITSLKMANELLLSDVGNDPATRAEFLAQNETQLRRLEWITHNLLDLSRLDAGIAALSLTEHDAGELLDSVAQPFRALAEQKQIALRVLPPVPPFKLMCDASRMEIALSNLVDNALKFTLAGGAVQVAAQVDGAMARFSVHDSGIGIAETDKPHIFERFYRGANHRADGSGLGLAIVRSIALAHGGTVQVESDVGKGSTFLVDIPVQSALLAAG